MKIIAATILIGSLALVGALPAAAAVGRSAFAVGSGTSLRFAAGDDTTSDRDSYTRKAHSDVVEWQRKLDNFGKRVEASGQATGKAAEKDLNSAWSKTEAASRQLEIAGDDGWDKSKAAFEKASNDLADAWHRNVPDDK
jgi:hypothetical protein